MEILQYVDGVAPKFNPKVVAVQEKLIFLGFKYRKQDGTFLALKPDGLYGEQTEKVVADFQASESIYSDGKVGPTTMRQLDKAYADRKLELKPPVKKPAKAKFTLQPVPCDKYGTDGYERGVLRNDAVDAYKKVRAEALAQGAILSSSGMMRALNAQVTASRSPVSYHYLGLALDLYIYSGMNDLATDPYIVTRDGGLKHRVWARCSDKWTFNKDKPAAFQLPAETELSQAITYKNRTATGVTPIKGKFIDLTALFQKHGFERISARKGFYTGDTMMGAEWWHFQYEKGLIPKKSTFGEELLKIHPEKTLKNTPPWLERKRIFKVDWF